MAKKMSKKGEGVFRALCAANHLIGTAMGDLPFTTADVRRVAGESAASSVKILKAKGFLRAANLKSKPGAMRLTKRGVVAINLCVRSREK